MCIWEVYVCVNRCIGVHTHRHECRDCSRMSGVLNYYNCRVSLLTWNSGFWPHCPSSKSHSMLSHSQFPSTLKWRMLPVVKPDTSMDDGYPNVCKNLHSQSWPQPHHRCIWVWKENQQRICGMKCSLDDGIALIVKKCHQLMVTKIIILLYPSLTQVSCFILYFWRLLQCFTEILSHTGWDICT